MRKWISASVFFAFVSLSSSVLAQPNNYQNAQNLIENWFAAMKNDQFDKAASFLAPQFVSLHTDGKVRDKNQEIELIKNLHMQNYKLTDFKFSRSGNDMIVTYKDKSMENIDNKPIANKAASRMAVLQKQKDKWLILAYANLDQIS